jgi:hypothetical protein
MKRARTSHPFTVRGSGLAGCVVVEMHGHRGLRERETCFARLSMFREARHPVPGGAARRPRMAHRAPQMNNAPIRSNGSEHRTREL